MFALLEHTTSGGVHWDFLIETPGRELLSTWRLLDDPRAPGDWLRAEPVADHQPRFLNYEGPLREGRGSVRRIDRGEARVERLDSGGLVAWLMGEVLRGRITIKPRGGAWTGRVDSGEEAGESPASTRSDR